MKYFSLIYGGDVHGNQKVIPKEEFSKATEAREIIEMARMEKERLLEETRSECEILKEEARNAGKSEGLQELTNKIAQIDAQFKEKLTEMNVSVPQIAIAAAKLIVGKILLNPEAVYDLVRTSLKEVADHKIFVIQLSSDDHEKMVKDPEWRHKLSDNLLTQIQTLKIEANDELTDGDVIITTNESVVQAKLDDVFDKLERSLTRKGDA